MKMGMLLYDARTEREKVARQAEANLAILEGQQLPVFPPSVVCEVVPSGEMIRWYLRRGIHSTTVAIINLTAAPGHALLLYGLPTIAETSVHGLGPDAVEKLSLHIERMVKALGLP